MEDKSDKKQNFGILAIVAIVAIIGMVILFNQKGSTLVSSAQDVAGEAYSAVDLEQGDLVGGALATASKVKSDSHAIINEVQVGQKMDYNPGSESMVNLYLNQVIANPSGSKDAEWCVVTTADELRQDITIELIPDRSVPFKTKIYKLDGSDDTSKADKIKATSTKVTAKLLTTGGQDGFCVRQSVKADKTPMLKSMVTYVPTNRIKLGRLLTTQWLEYNVYIGTSKECEASDAKDIYKCVLSSIKGQIPSIGNSTGECPAGCTPSAEQCASV